MGVIVEEHRVLNGAIVPAAFEPVVFLGVCVAGVKIRSLRVSLCRLVIFGGVIADAVARRIVDVAGNIWEQRMRPLVVSS